MKKNEIKVGGLYRARVNGNYVTVRVDSINEIEKRRLRGNNINGQSIYFGATTYDVTNLATGRKLTFHSAAKFRSEVKEVQPDAATPKPSLRWSSEAPPTRPLTNSSRTLAEQSDSKTSDEDCLACGGTGIEGEENQCESCDGTGKVVEDQFRDVQADAVDTLEDIKIEEIQRRIDRLDHEPDFVDLDVPEDEQPELCGLYETGGTYGCSKPRGHKGDCNGDGQMEDEQRADPTIHTVGVMSAKNPSTETASEESAVRSATDHVLGATTEGEQHPTFVSIGTETFRTLGGGLAAQIAAQATKTAPTTGLTQEQQDILAIAQEIQARRDDGERSLVICAGAGTGKTFTLTQLEKVLAGIGQYTAFNSSLVAESKAKFKRAACNTTHSLAFRPVGCRFAHRLNTARVRSYEVASMLSITSFITSGVPYPRDSHEYCEAAINAGYGSDNPPPDDFEPAPQKILKAAFLAGQVMAAIRRFCQSDRREISTKDFHNLPGLDKPGEYTNSDAVKAYLLPFARNAWADLTDETGTLPFSHDVYVKIWQLGQGTDRPVIAADYILLDEHQDTAPVMVDILRQQEHAFVILVGDDNQRIYEWRGAVNAGDYFPDAARRLLSKSFRFGQIVADVANSVLAHLEEKTDLVMSGLETIPSRVCVVEQPRCYLYRTNAGAVGKLMSAMAEGKRGHLIGGTKEVVDFCRAAEDLQAKRGTAHPELGCFQTWEEVQTYSKEEEGKDLRLMVKLIDEFGAQKIREALEDMPKEEHADLVLSTAHRSKGREWSSVKLGGDFPTKNKMSDADVRLVYVAATRAQEELDISECPTFCGGWDCSFGSKEWIPGIEVTYTVPMPTEADVAAYRAARAAAKSPTTAPAYQRADGPANAQVQAPGPIPAPATASGPVVFSWANLDGQWAIKGPVGYLGQRVTVTKKNGTTSQETLRRVVKEGHRPGDLAFNVCYYATR